MKQVAISLESHVGKQVDLVVIAGEHSGDQHAASMVNEIKKARPDINVVAFGGPALRRAGVDLICNMTRFSVVGVYEVLVNFFFFFRLLRRVFLWIKINNPRAVCLVDYPGFNLRLAKMLFTHGLSKKGGGNISVLYYISPQIWAWKARRRHQIAKFVDKMAIILPFEKKCFEDTVLDVSFVGHPFAEKDHNLNVSYNPDGPILLLPGSRRPAVRTIFPVLLSIFREILRNDMERMAIVAYPDEAILAILRRILNKKFSKLLNKVTFIPDGENMETSAAIMSSGTMSLRCCLAGIPGAIVYKTHPLTYAVGKVLTKVKFLGIANVLLGRCAWKEFLQSRLKVRTVAKYITNCLENSDMIDSFEAASLELKKILSVSRDMSAAEWMLSAIG
ncbi:MAG: lipid-A-disaccharide synthase [Puniceicoccales bacterium]|nr:lipid-A-disaccharide synthase [Puniceicoccales bacterium]